jgi:hypothetical protein
MDILAMELSVYIIYTPIKLLASNDLGIGTIHYKNYYREIIIIL